MPEIPLQTPNTATLMAGRLPVVVETPLAQETPAAKAPSRRAATVRAVIPCHNRPADLESLLKDLSGLDLQTGAGAIDLEILVVDNASQPPVPVPPQAAPVRMLRLSINTGGSGGFNAGLAAHLAAWEAPATDTDFLWLIDSDVRVRPGTLRVLVETLADRPDLVAVGAALADPTTGEVFEVGGRVDRRNGTYGPVHQWLPVATDPVPCDYVASCCALVRRSAVERIGLMPDRFINGDDVEWFIRLAHGTGRRVACVPRALAAHPRFDRFPTWTRAYATRNAFGPIAALGLGLAARLRRALVAVGQAVNQAMMGRRDLAELHVLGLREAAAGRTTGRIAAPLPALEPFQPLTMLGAALKTHGKDKSPRSPAWFHPALDLPRPAMEELRRQLVPVPTEAESPGVRRRPVTVGGIGALRRALFGPEHDIAVVPAEGRPSSWLRGRLMVQVVPEGFVIRPGRAPGILSGALATALRAIWPAIRAALRRAPQPKPAFKPTIAPAAPTRAPTLSVVVLSYNRRPALEKTLAQLTANPTLKDAEIIVADNGSHDGSASLVRERFPRARPLDMGANLGVAAFNRAAQAARGDLLLVLDDDAHPEPAALAAAVDLMAQREDVAAVALHPVHPADGRSEWPWATSAGRREDWPVMGCGNLVRRADWLAAGGYEESFFLYRNDTDLAMKLLGAGRAVAFDPSWVVWHESPAAARKSDRWFELATRNWLWLARRHGRGLAKLWGSLLGWAWAHRLAGLNPLLHRRVLQGAWAGIVRSPAPLPPTVRPDGQAFARLISLQVSSRTRSTRSEIAPRALAGVPAGPGLESAGRNGTIDPSSPRHSA